MEVAEISNFRQLNDSWCLWAHLPHDTEWNLNSYKEIMTFNTVEEAEYTLPKLSDVSYGFTLNVKDGALISPTL